MATHSGRTWENRRSAGRARRDDAPVSYYGLPVIKSPHWRWLIVWYFFLGGISAASYVIATISSWFGGKEGRRIAQVGHYVSLAALIPSPILLILDLGRPERFLNMLRVFKLRSPMSLGTWGLTIFGGFCGLSAVIQAVSDGLFGRRTFVVRLVRLLPHTIIHALGSVFAFFVGGYTGVLIAATAVPVWAKNRLLLGPLFLSSAMSSGVASISLALTLFSKSSHEARKRLERLELLTMLGELGLLIAIWRTSGPIIGRPLREGRLGRIFRVGVLGAGIGAPLALQAPALLRGRSPSRLTAALSAVLTLIGGFLLRYVFVMAGPASAEDPEATFEFTRHKESND